MSLDTLGCSQQIRAFALQESVKMFGNIMPGPSEDLVLAVAVRFSNYIEGGQTARLPKPLNG